MESRQNDEQACCENVHNCGILNKLFWFVILFLRKPSLRWSGCRLNRKSKERVCLRETWAGPVLSIVSVNKMTPYRFVHRIQILANIYGLRDVDSFFFFPWCQVSFHMGWHKKCIIWSKHRWVHSRPHAPEENKPDWRANHIMANFLTFWWNKLFWGGSTYKWATTSLRHLI